MGDSDGVERQWIDLPIIVACDEGTPTFEIALEPLGDTMEIRPGQKISFRLRGNLVGELMITREARYVELWANGVDVSTDPTPKE